MIDQVWHKKSSILSNSKTYTEKALQKVDPHNILYASMNFYLLNRLVIEMESKLYMKEYICVYVCAKGCHSIHKIIPITE